MIAHGKSSGKIILLGEHAVVYGCPAIAAGIDKGAHATARRARSSTLELGGNPGPACQEDLHRAFAALLESLSSNPVAVRAESEVPPGLGLGASAALGVCVARAVLAANSPSSDDDPSEESLDAHRRVTNAAQAWETVFHGRPSGIDVAAAAHGGCFEFTTEQGPKPLHVTVPIPIAVAVAGPAVSTKTMVDGLAQLRQQKPELVNRCIEGIRSLVQNARLALEGGDLPCLGRLLDLNQMLLAGLFLSSKPIESACSIARGAGALGAKLTGKGGGGCVIALCESDPKPVLDAWRNNGIECFSTVIRPRS
jgi:mevalonate kinase